MPRIVLFTPEAQTQLAELFGYIAEVASPKVAAEYTEGIIAFCEGMQNLPHRGIKRDDIRPGLRITNHRKRVAIAFFVDKNTVAIIGIFYGGQDYKTILTEPDNNKSE